MAVQTVTRDIQVKFCDECNKEKDFLDRCGICRKDKCNSHMAYAFDDLVRYSDNERVGGRGRHICKDCAGNRTGSIGQLLDLILAK